MADGWCEKRNGAPCEYAPCEWYGCQLDAIAGVALGMPVANIEKPAADFAGAYAAMERLVFAQAPRLLAYGNGLGVCQPDVGRWLAEFSAAMIEELFATKRLYNID